MDDVTFEGFKTMREMIAHNIQGLRDQYGWMPEEFGVALVGVALIAFLGLRKRAK